MRVYALIRDADESPRAGDGQTGLVFDPAAVRISPHARPPTHSASSSAMLSASVKKGETNWSGPRRDDSLRLSMLSILLNSEATSNAVPSDDRRSIIAVPFIVARESLIERIVLACSLSSAEVGTP